MVRHPQMKKSFHPHKLRENFFLFFFSNAGKSVFASLLKKSHAFLQIYQAPDDDPTLRVSRVALQVTRTVKNTLPRRRLPCSSRAQDNEGLLECIEEYFERELECVLPWREDQERECPLRTCSTAEDLERYDSLVINFF